MKWRKKMEMNKSRAIELDIGDCSDDGGVCVCVFACDSVCTGVVVCLSVQNQSKTVQFVKCDDSVSCVLLYCATERCAFLSFFFRRRCVVDYMSLQRCVATHHRHLDMHNLLLISGGCCVPWLMGRDKTATAAAQTRFSRIDFHRLVNFNLILN